ncbi:hypothetical protein TROLL_5 [Bacillus phage Troll]|uniref:Uncharacterized protein n=2 Tax=Bequatrovirus TaxID=1917990 RepID=A0A0K2D137_9CAUD|nr:hypothetical protein TROLL_5 [Bacillus phage Troll]YP_009206360.1 hypothetical protein AVV02_gp005 [Bacillus phage AvesoBmore]YP_009206656.1 hypothetical protein AVV02_gp301 [Bacillus phage AvesoBmore]AGT13447.1 hypothetical protein TROLL_5 [Bacillus phage Troll]ALA13440.1 hypothetical protein AVESOBMORE_301 [Bacillus phage AvesoBmore]ALA13470.1 hypothetical protein AVESOBMORE_5 [Bacillus phage AvesoBmore]
MKRILKAITGLYNRLVCKEANTIDNTIERMQEGVRAYNTTIDVIISQNANLLNSK